MKNIMSSSKNEYKFLKMWIVWNWYDRVGRTHLERTRLELVCLFFVFVVGEWKVSLIEN